MLQALKVEHTLLTETLKQAMTDEWVKIIRINTPDSNGEGTCRYHAQFAVLQWVYSF